jgi:CO/xanthine dehydrogenase Mo-binding subunit
VTVISKHIEFGQGNHAGLAAIVAEELDADWTQGPVEQAPANAKLYANGALGAQLTGGSSAISNSWTSCARPARRAGDVRAGRRRQVERPGRRDHGQGQRPHPCLGQDRRLRRAAGRRRQDPAARRPS